MSIPLVDIPSDLDTVTAIGPEDDPAAAALTRGEVEAVWASVRRWYRLGTTPAIQICLRRHGSLVLNRAIGHARGNAPGDGPDADREPITVDTPFCGFSTAKGVAATVMYMLIEQGAFAPEDRVCDYIPEFAAHRKGRITIADVLTHSAGVPFMPAGFHGFDTVVDEELATRALIALRPSWAPGQLRVYHALTSGLILRLLVHRATGKRMRDQLAEQILDPLGFRWTNFGVRPEDVDRVAPSVRTGPRPSRAWSVVAGKALGGAMISSVSESAYRDFLTAEIPSGNLVTTAVELSRFYEILCRGGELDGVRILSPESVRRAIRPAPRIPGIAGRVSAAGFELGGRRSKFGAHTESHFGRSGLTTQYGWADIDRRLSGAVLTSGKATTDTERPWQLCAQISAIVPHTADRAGARAATGAEAF